MSLSALSDADLFADPFALLKNDGRERLSDEIIALITPYCWEEHEEPPFSPGDLVVMATICAYSSPIDKGDIYDWVCKNFKYYQRKAIEAYSRTQIREQASSVNRPEDVVPGLHRCFDDWYLPVVCYTDEIVMSSWNEGADFSIPEDAARIYLQKWLEPKRLGTFPSMSLPAELRNKIYGMVLCFATSGLRIECFDEGPVQYQALEREVDYGEELEVRSWRTYSKQKHDYAVYLPPSQEVLALLSVNKQIHEEATPIFYGSNHFRLDLTRNSSSCCFAKAIPSSRIKHLTDIYQEISLVGHLRHGLENFEANMRSLIHIKSLKSLKIEMKHQILWLNLPANERRLLGRKTRATKVEQLPGFRNLVKVALRAEKLKIYGDCGTFRQWITEEMEKAKLKSKTSLTSKKRVRMKEDTTSNQVDEAGRNMNMDGGGASKKRKKESN